MDRDLERSKDPLGRPLGDEVYSGQQPGRSIESGPTDLPDEDPDSGADENTAGGRPASM